VIRDVHVIVDGKLRRAFSPNQREISLTVPLDLTGWHYVYVYLLQSDGNQAWSSPIWLIGDPADGPLGLQGPP
jgi:hypothetical protein